MLNKSVGGADSSSDRLPVSVLSARSVSSYFLSVISIWGGSLVILVSVGLIVDYLGQIIEGTAPHGVPLNMGLIAFLSGLVFLVFRLVNGQLKERQAMKELNQEQILLSCARGKGGVVTVTEAALQSRLSILDTKRAFERLSALGVCQVDVTEQGELCYRFASFEAASAGSAALIAPQEVEVKKRDLP